MAKSRRNSEGVRDIGWNDPENKKLLGRFPPVPCVTCGGITGLYGTPGVLRYLSVSGALLTCSEGCEQAANYWLVTDSATRVAPGVKAYNNEYARDLKRMIPHATRSCEATRKRKLRKARFG